MAAADRSRRNGFAFNPLDRRSALREDAAALAAARAAPESRVLVFAGDRLLMDPAAPAEVTMIEAARLGAAVDDAVLLGFEASGRALFAAALNPAAVSEADAHDRFADLRALALEGRLAGAMMGAAAQGRSMLGWHERHRFCAACGRPTRVAAAGYRRDCEACGAQHFPRTDPVVIMAIRHGERLLLGRQARFRPGSYSCLAGFLEPGETIEDAVRREVLEEAGVVVGRVDYHSSQPWPFVSSLMIGCIGEAQTDRLVIDREELEDCRWFPRAEVRAMLEGTHGGGLTCPPAYAIARALLEAAVAD